MEDSLYAVRTFLDSDYEAEARIDLEFDPEHAGTAEEIRHWDEFLRLEPGRINLKFAVDERATETMVAYGSLTQPSFNYDPRWFWIWVAVTPGHRSKGIGARLFDLLEGEARARGGDGLWGTNLDDNPVGARFLERRGFRVLQKSWLSRLDLASLEHSKVLDRSKSLEQDGIRFSTLAEEGATSPNVRQALYRLGLLTGKDVPRIGGYHAFTFDEYVALEIEGPGSLPEGMFLAWKGAELVGMSHLERDLGRPDTLRVGYTGTHPSFRGRGIASELKRRAAVFARGRGYRFLVTGNNSQNQPILAINNRFGFVPEASWAQSEKLLHKRPNLG